MVMVEEPLLLMMEMATMVMMVATMTAIKRMRAEKRQLAARR